MDFSLFINEIKGKTGIDVSCYDENGVLLCGNSEGNISVPKDTDIFLDTLNQATIFAVKYNNKNIYCKIDGATEAEKRYSIFITEIAKTFFSKAELSKAEVLRAVMQNEITATELIKYAEKLSLPKNACFVMVATINQGNIKDVKNAFIAYSGYEKDFVYELGKKRCALVKFVDEFEQEYRSHREYAEFLVRSVYEETGISVNIAIGSTVENYLKIAESYSQALSASETVIDIKKGGEVHTFKEYVFDNVLKDLPEEKRLVYLKTLMDAGAKEIFSDKDMVLTALGFIENDFNVSETSRKLFLHRNTLNYRLDKIEKITGLNVRKFTDALTFKLIATLTKLIK